MKPFMSPAKITRPRSAGVFTRDRLFRLLDHSAQQPIIWITGPPGTGKTTLAASWLDSRKMPSLWYQVEDGDTDPASFFYYLGLAAKRFAPRKRKPLPLLTPEYLQGIPTFSRRYFEDLYARLLPLKGNICPAIVFDNYQEVPEMSPLHAILYEGLSRVPDGMKIVLISRKDPPEAFVRLRANSLMKIIGWDELKFTLDESNGMVRLRGHEVVSSEVLEQLHERTDGWAAGIVLLLEGAKSGGIESVLSRVYAPKEIFQYFAGELFNRAGAATRDFLLKTSLFPQMSSKMAQTLTGNNQARRLLSELNARNYFTQKLESETDFYQYHPLFREFLQFMAGETFSLDALQQMQKKAALLLEENGHPEDAVELLRKAEDWTDAARLILKHAPSLSAQGRGQTLASWINGLPETVIHGEPWLLYWLGACRLPFSPPESQALFEEAFNFFRAQRDTVGVFLSLSGLFDSIAYALSSYVPFDRAIALLEEILKEFQDLPSLEIETRLISSTLYAIVLRQLQHPDFPKLAERTLSLLPMVQDINLKMHMLHPLVLHCLFSGEISKAGPLFDLLSRLTLTPNVSPLLQIHLKNARSFYCWLKGEFPEGKRASEEGLGLASTTGVHLLDAYLLGHGAAGELSSGDMETASSYIQRMAAHLDHAGVWTRSFYHFLSGWRLLIQSDFSNSLQQLEMSLKLGLEAGVPQTVAYSHVGCALVLHELKRDHLAMAHIAECHAIARSSGVPIAEFMCFLVEARVRFDKEDDLSGFAALGKALSLGREKGYVSSFLWVSAVIAELCKRALEAGIEVEYVRYLIRKRNLMPDPPPVDCERWPWALKIYTLGRFEIVKDGQALQFSGKVQKKPLQMLKVLISYGGGEVSEEHIADCLWPDAAGDAAHSAFTTTLSRLRRLIGLEKAIKAQEGKVSLDPRYCWVDASAFERILARLDKSILHRENSEILRLAEKALAVYRGHFLPADEGEFWTISYRERLRARLSRLISSVGDWLEEAKRWEKAIECYHKGLDIDDVSEEFYQRLMICYRQLGLHANAIEVYRRCEKLLSSKMGIEPSGRTDEIRRSITSIISST